MQTWLDVLRTELSNIEPGTVAEPEDEVGAKDTVVGDVPDELKQIRGLALRWKTDCLFELTDALKRKLTGNQEEAERAFTKSSELSLKADTLMQIFWTSLKDALGLWEKDAIGIRKGWKVVSFENEEKPDMPRIILGGILGVPASLVGSEEALIMKLLRNQGNVQ
ncbi:MAG TPA: hypothetical protein VJC16_01955 [Candidatus Nanoarchaeia archaeon]|nr:hypothetical protein [Candidatus Nanoarchaeia archaeon]